MSESLTSRTMRGLNWSYLGTVVNALVQLSFTAIMARLLDPAAFGLMAMAGIVLRFGSYFATMGIGPALIQRQELTKADVRASFSFSVLSACLLFVIFWLAAPLAARVFDSTQVIAVVRALAFGMVLEGFYITAVSLLRRQMRFRTLALIEATTFLFGYVLVGITLARQGLGIWSLVIASLCQSALLVILSNVFARHSWVPLLGWRYYKQLAGYGGRFSVVSFVQFLYYSVQPIIIGRFHSSVVLGYYSSAQRLANLPFEYLMTALNRVLFPSFSRIQAERTRLKKNFLSAHLLIAIAFFPVAYGMVPAAQEIVLTVLGPKWIESVAIFRILLLAVPFTFLNSLNGVVCDASANLNIKLTIEVSAIALIGILALTLGRNAILALVACYSVVEVLRFATYLVFMGRIVGINSRDLVPIYAITLANTAAVVAAIASVRYVLVHFGAAQSLILTAEILVGASVFVLVTFFKAPRLVRMQVGGILLRTGPDKPLGSKSGRLLAWLARCVLQVHA